MVMSEAGNVWIGFTNELKRGKYRYKIVYKLKFKELGEETVTIEEDEIGRPLFVVAE
jgi:hypothetical protein